MKRRDFIAGLGAAAAWPMAAGAQQRERMRRVGVLLSFPEGDPEASVRIAAFREGLKKSGWTEGQNLQIDYRWYPGDAERHRALAQELVSVGPDVLLGGGGAATASLLQVTRTVPIVFAAVIDPVRLGFVESIAHPGGNATGFAAFFEVSTSAKWLELLKEVAPQTKRVAVIIDLSGVNGPNQFNAITAAAAQVGVQVSMIDARDPGEMERAVKAFGQQTGGGLLVPQGVSAGSHRDLIIELALTHRLPAVYALRVFVTSGGLLSYAPDQIDDYRRAADYVDRILRGRKPSDLPVQAPVRFQTVINLKTAKAIGLEVPTATLLRADEVIE